MRATSRPRSERVAGRGVHSPFRVRRGGFTLVELLVTILVIGILSGLVFGALQRAGSVSRVVHTKSTIAKLNASLMDRWDSYRTRRLPVDPLIILAAIKASGGSSYGNLQTQISAMSARRIAASGGSLNAYPTSPFDPLSVPYSAPAGVYPNAQLAAAVRVLAMREIIRYEMPQHFDDFIGNFSSSTAAGGFTLRGTDVLPVPPPIATTYLAAVNTASINGATFAQIKSNDAAECLYMILTIGSTDSGMFGEQMPNQDVGDVDGDGLPEFQDAWPVMLNSFTPIGQANSPINFLRWAPGFVSDLQPDPTFPNVTEFSVSRHDFFDPLKLDIPSSNSSPPRGFQLTPLIYSAGPDGVWDIDPGQPTTIDPYDATGPLAGTAGPAASDNLTNHELDTRTGR